MGDIYTERGITETPTVNIGEMSTASDVRRTGKIFDDIKEQAQEKAEKHQRLAKELYKNGSSLAIHNGLEELLRNPDLASNPEAYSREADKVASKVYGDIQDQEVKAEVILDYELRKGAFVNKTYSNYYKKQDDEKEYQTLVSIDNAMKNTGISLQNIMNGDFSVDDLRVLSEGRRNLDKYLEAKDAEGFNLFTPNQRIQMEKQYSNGVVERLKGGYLQLGVHQRQRIVDMLKNDEFGVTYADKDGLVHQGDIKNMLPTESYLDFKDYVLEAHKRASSTSGGDDEITPEAQALADLQLTNSIALKSDMKTIKDVRKEKPVEAVTRTLELMDNIQLMGDTGLSKSDKKTFVKESVESLLDMVKNDPLTGLSKQEDKFDDALWQESVMSVGLQAMKRDGKIKGDAWADPMSVVMIRDFYSMLKESGVDPRATDSVSREKAKELATKAISNTIEKAIGGYGKDFNSAFIYGNKVSKEPIKDEGSSSIYNNKDYIIQNGQKHYIETGINVPTA